MDEIHAGRVLCVCLHTVRHTLDYFVSRYHARSPAPNDGHSSFARAAAFPVPPFRFQRTLLSFSRSNMQKGLQHASFCISSGSGDTFTESESCVSSSVRVAVYRVITICCIVQTAKYSVERRHSVHRQHNNQHLSWSACVTY